MMRVWDYAIDKDWKPRTDRQWLWYLERKINYDDWKGLKKAWIKKYFSQLQRRLDPGKRRMLQDYLEHLEFVHYDHPQLKRREVWNGISIDSFDDIATNKLMALFDRNEPKDIVDLYFLLTKGGYALDALLQFVEQKFGVRFEKSAAWSEAFKGMEELNNLQPLLPGDSKEKQRLVGEIKSYFREQSKEFLDRELT